MRSEIKTVNEALNSDLFTPREKIIIKWQFKKFGSFFQGLMDLIVVADHLNRQCLAQAFPTHVKAYEEWMNEPDNYIEDLSDV